MSLDNIEYIINNLIDAILEHQYQLPSFELPINESISLSHSAPGIFDIRVSETTSDTKSIILSCGVHGNETAPIEICAAILRDIANGKLTLKHHLMLQFGNLQAMKIGERFVEENMNRLFMPNLELINFERERAQELMDATSEFFAKGSKHRIHYDLHTAIRPSKNEKFAVYPFIHGAPYNKDQLRFLSACDVNTILLSQNPTTTYSYYSSRYHQAEAFTVELGKVMPFGENDMTRFEKVDLYLRQLVSQEQPTLPEYSDCPLEIFRVNQAIMRHKEDFKLHFADDLANFSGFPKDTVIASETGAEYKTQEDGEAIVFPNANVALGQRALLTVVPDEI